MPICVSSSDLDFAAVIEAAAESILITTADLDAPGPSIVYVNSAFEKMTGWSSSEVIGKSPRIMQGPKTDLSVFRNMRDALQLKGFWEGRTTNYRKNGTAFWMEWTVVPLVGDEGQVYRYVAVQRDVTERFEAEKRLWAARSAASKAERAKANLSRYFSPKLAEALSKKDQPLGAVKRQKLAVLFADIVGFTAISETMKPEEVLHLLRDVHRLFETSIFKWHGSIEGYVGDEVLAIFGFPDDTSQNATNALCCAFDLLTATQIFNIPRIKAGLPAVNIGIGLQFGPVVLGDVGTENFVEFTVIGDTVNTASRLQEATRTLGCDLVVGEELINAVKAEGVKNVTSEVLARMTPQGELSIRGKARTVNIWNAIISL